MFNESLKFYFDLDAQFVKDLREAIRKALTPVKSYIVMDTSDGTNDLFVLAYRMSNDPVGLYKIDYDYPTFETYKLANAICLALNDVE